MHGFGHLRADCRGPGSAPEPYARYEYGNRPTITFIMMSALKMFTNDKRNILAQV